MPRARRTTTRRRGNPIPPELRPVLIERIGQLRDEGMFDPEIGQVLGYAKDTIRLLRHEGGIPSVPRKTAVYSRPRDDPARFHRECPACGLLVDVRSDVIEDHRGFLGRTAPGAKNGMPVQVAEPCPASYGRYSRFTRAELERAA